ncbi:MAG: hypothetical protein AB1489_24525, partial [Acidobacteriota bacterium]
MVTILVCTYQASEQQKRRAFTLSARPTMAKSLIVNNQLSSAQQERFNLTDRTRNARKVRKSLNFSKDIRQHAGQSFINALLYNFH